MQPKSIPQSYKFRRQTRGYILIVVVMVIALLSVAAVSLLALTRSGYRASDSSTARLRAKIAADAGLADALSLLHEHTRFGNYVTASAPLADTSSLPVHAPQLIPEIYRPTLFPGEDPTGKYLIPDDPSFPVTGDYLFSLSTGDFKAAPDDPDEDSGVLVAARPRAKDDVRGSLTTATDTDGDGGGDSFSTFFGETVPTSEPAEVTATSLVHPAGYQITIPTLEGDNAYNFNQKIHIAGRDSYLVQPPAREGEGAPNALGQWVYTRDTQGEINGRFAFFIEDESTKVNADTSGLTTRSDDIVAPLPNHLQVADVDPVAMIANPADVTSARSALTASGTPGGRIPSARSISLLDPAWESAYPDAAPFLTAYSKSDLTTAKGWKRLDVNAVVADNAPAAAAHIISGWIRDAWPARSRSARCWTTNSTPTRASAFR